MCDIEIAQLGRPLVPIDHRSYAQARAMVGWYKKQYEEMKGFFHAEQAERHKWEARAMSMFWAGDNSPLGEVREMGERFVKFLQWEAEQEKKSRECEKCNGSGGVAYSSGSPGMPTLVIDECPDCKGTGEKPDGPKPE